MTNLTQITWFVGQFYGMYRMDDGVGRYTVKNRYKNRFNAVQLITILYAALR